jgi:hypothetical protein
VPYSLVVVGETFVKKPAAARTRLTRELSNFLGEEMGLPVIGVSDLRAKLRFGPTQVVHLAAAATVVGLIYYLLFTHQEQLLSVLGGSLHQRHPWMSPVLVAVVAPLVAAAYGVVASSLLKLIKLE